MRQPVARSKKPRTPPWISSVSTNRTPSSRSWKNRGSVCSAGCGPKPGSGRASARPNPAPRRSAATAEAVIDPRPLRLLPPPPATTRRAGPVPAPRGGPRNEMAPLPVVLPGRRGRPRPLEPQLRVGLKAMAGPTAMPVAGARPGRPPRILPMAGRVKAMRRSRLAPAPGVLLLEPVPAGRPMVKAMTMQPQAQEAGWTFHSTSRG
ncbi:MAG: hypothetical protein QOF20_3162 [Acidimicrobiaceae bacterium]|nr:hypothetical protein [Acidimicrobiaceae bacterium]